MARQGKGIFDSFSGNIGDIQGSKFGNLGVIKSKNTKSVKTQTQALTKTKTDFELALEFYELAVNSKLKPLFEKKYPKTTAKQHFLSVILRMLNAKSIQYQILDLFPDSIPYDKMLIDLTSPTFPYNWRVFLNRFPRSPKATRNDGLWLISYNGSTGEKSVNDKFRRGTAYFEISQEEFITRGHRRFLIVFFTNPTFTECFKAYAISGLY